MQRLSTALDKAANFVRTSISKVSELSKPQQKFIIWLLERWWLLPVRYNFLNLSRYGGYSEKTVRHQFSVKLPFVPLFHQLFDGLRKKKCIAAFDASFIYKSGKKSYGLSRFWNSTAQRAEKGLEIGCLAIVDVKDGAAYSMEVVQTPAAGAEKKEEENLLKHYASCIVQSVEDILKYTSVLTVDGYFMKAGFIGEMMKAGLQVITKARKDANMLYLYKGPLHKGKGRKKVYDGKVDFETIDKRRWKLCCKDDRVAVYEAVLWSVVLKRKVKVVYVKAKGRKGYEILISTETVLNGEDIVKYYRLRFQIEFLLRDAKGHTGLEHCQARSEEKLYNHFNMAMLSVSVAKYQSWAKWKDKEQKAFSMRAVKTGYWNKYMTQTIFSNLALDLSLKKIKRIYEQCLNIGQMAA